MQDIITFHLQPLYLMLVISCVAFMTFTTCDILQSAAHFEEHEDGVTDNHQIFFKSQV